MKMRIMVGLIKICVNMDEEKQRKIGENEEKKWRGEARKKKRERESQLTLGQCVGPTSSVKNIEWWKKVIVPNGLIF